MRAYNKTGSLSVHAIAGAYVVLLGIDMEEAASEGVLGFGIERVEHGHGNSRAWLRALKVFPDVPVQEGMVSTEQHPIQGFFWGDFTLATVTSIPTASLRCGVSPGPCAPLKLSRYGLRRRRRTKDSTRSTSTAALPARRLMSENLVIAAQRTSPIARRFSG